MFMSVGLGFSEGHVYKCQSKMLHEVHPSYEFMDNALQYVVPPSTPFTPRSDQTPSYTALLGDQRHC